MIESFNSDAHINLEHYIAHICRCIVHSDIVQREEREGEKGKGCGRSSLL
jgi:hypothetical protein